MIFDFHKSEKNDLFFNVFKTNCDFQWKVNSLEQSRTQEITEKSKMKLKKRKEKTVLHSNGRWNRSESSTKSSSGKNKRLVLSLIPDTFHRLLSAVLVEIYLLFLQNTLLVEDSLPIPSYTQCVYLYHLQGSRWLVSSKSFLFFFFHLFNHRFCTDKIRQPISKPVTQNGVFNSPVQNIYIIAPLIT